MFLYLYAWWLSYTENCFTSSSVLFKKEVLIGISSCFVMSCFLLPTVFSFHREYFFFCVAWNHGTASCVKLIRSSVVFICFFWNSYAPFSFGYTFFTFDYVIILFGYALFSFDYVYFSVGYGLFSSDYVQFSFGYTLFCYAFPSLWNFCDSWCFRKVIL